MAANERGKATTSGDFLEEETVSQPLILNCSGGAACQILLLQAGAAQGF
jgi:hypothetical protein